MSSLSWHKKIALRARTRDVIQTRGLRPYRGIVGYFSFETICADFLSVGDRKHVRWPFFWLVDITTNLSYLLVRWWLARKGEFIY